MINLNNSRNEFGEFITKSVGDANNNVSHSNAVVIKKNTDSNDALNVWRNLCSRFTAEGDTSAIPLLTVIDTDGDFDDKGFSDKIRKSKIEFSLEYNSVMLAVPKNFTNSVQSGEEHIKTKLIDSIIVKENSKFAKEVNIYLNDKITSTSKEKTINDTMRSLISKIDVRYIKNAVFMMSSKIYHQLITEKNSSNSYYQNGYEFCGHRIVIENQIVLADFEEAFVIGDSNNDKIDVMTDVKHPSLIFYTFTSGSKIQVIDNKAIVYSVYTVDAAN